MTLCGRGEDETIISKTISTQAMPYCDRRPLVPRGDRTRMTTLERHHSTHPLIVLREKVAWIDDMVSEQIYKDASHTDKHKVHRSQPNQEEIASVILPATSLEGRHPARMMYCYFPALAMSVCPHPGRPHSRFLTACRPRPRPRGNRRDT
jgi:hypothetical protein